MSGNCFAAALNRFGIWCQPTGCLGQPIRYLFRKGIPLSVATIAGLAAGQFIVRLLEDEPLYLNIALSDLTAVVTAGLTQLMLDRLCECCWHSHYNDNFREYVAADIEAYLPSEQYLAELNSPLETEQQNDAYSI